MSPRSRNPENKVLPSRWRYKHGAYYYRVPEHLRPHWDGKTEFMLGKTIQEAYRAFAARVEAAEDTRTAGQLLDRYSIEVIPRKAPRTQESNYISVRRLRPVFGDMPVSGIKPRHAYKYMSLVTRKNGAASANRDFEVLCHSMSMAVMWGVIDRNPLKGQVRKNRIARRERYVENWELEEALAVANPVVRAYIILKCLTGLRRGDLLRLEERHLGEDGIYVKTSKTGAALTIEWTDELREAVAVCLAVRPKDNVPWLFCTRKGGCYVDENGKANAFDSLWQRFMRKVVLKTKVSERFQEKDLRKKTASDMPLELAKQLLGHASAATTRRHYRLTGDRVKPHSIQRQKP